MDNKLVIIVNGKPRAGKDTFAKILDKYISVYKYSAIDKIKEIAIDCGWKGGKTERDRKFLSDLKVLTTEYSDLPFNAMLDKVIAFYSDEIKEDVLLIDIREPEEIQRAREVFSAMTVFIKNDRVKHITSNPADANVENYEYDFYIENNGTLQEFEQNIRQFYYEILKEL